MPPATPREMTLKEQAEALKLLARARALVKGWWLEGNLSMVQADQLVDEMDEFLDLVPPPPTTEGA